MPGPVSIGMGYSIRVQLLEQEIYLGLTNHPVQLSLAIPPWVRAMNTGQRAGAGGDVLWLGSKGRYGLCLMAGKTV